MRKTVAFGLGIFVLAGLGGGCNQAPPKPDPTPEEWSRAVERPAAAPVRVAPNVSAPRLVSPREGAVLTTAELARDQGVVVFSWTSSAPDVVYELELARDRNFTDVLFTSAVPRNTLPYRFSRIGTYYWRVRVSGKGGASSGVQWFEISE